MAENICQDSVNPLYNNYFRFTIGRGTRQLELMVQKVNLPGLSIPDQKQPTIFGTTVPIPTLVADFDPLSIEFMVDSNMVNWLSIYSWMRNLSNIENADDHNLPNYQDWHHSALLEIPNPIVESSTNTRAITQQKPLKVQFYNVIPSKLSGMIFQADGSDAMPLKATCSFKYSFYNIAPPHNPPSNLLSQTTVPYV